MQAIVRDKGGGVEFQSPSQPPVVQQPQQQQQQQQQKPKQKPKITPPQATSSSNAARSRASLPKSKPAPAPAPAPTPKQVPAPVISTPAPAAPIRKKTANSIFGLNLDDSPPVKSIASARSSTSTIGSEQSERSVPPKSAKKKAASLPPSQKQRTRQSVAGAGAGAGAGTNKGRRMSVEDMQGIVMDKATVR